MAFVLVILFLNVRTPEGSISSKMARVDWLYVLLHSAFFFGILTSSVRPVEILSSLLEQLWPSLDSHGVEAATLGVLQLFSHR